MNELALHILDIAQNSIRANAGLIEITIAEKPDSNLLYMEIKDNGKGMNPQQAEQAADPFFTSRTKRKVGLGLPLLKHNAELTEGSFQLYSEENEGTQLQVNFGFHHIDRPVLGDIAGTLLILAANEKQTDIRYLHETPKGQFEFDTRDVKKELDGIPLSAPEIRKFLNEMIRENLEQIQISE
jgi:hypothetical protein